MSFIADITLAGAALAAAFYCLILSRRLRKFTDLESGVGNAVALLALKSSELDKAVKAAQATATQSVKRLEDVSSRAEAAARHLELLVASLHSLPDVPQAKADQAPNPFRAHRGQGNGASRP